MTSAEIKEQFGSPIRYAAHTMMDLQNNRAGIEFARRHMGGCPGPSWSACAQVARTAVIRDCKDAAMSGALKTIVGATP